MKKQANFYATGKAILFQGIDMGEPAIPVQPATPIQDFIGRMVEKRDATTTDLARDTYQELIFAAGRHLTSYKETKIPEFIHYLDEHAELPGMHPQARLIIQEQANDLQSRIGQ